MSLFGAELLFTFSPMGLRSLYEVRESDASFTEATRGLLGLKLPAEVIEGGNMKKFYQVGAWNEEGRMFEVAEWMVMREDDRA